MFYVIRHKPTKIWLPTLSSGGERSELYSFLENHETKLIPAHFTYRNCFRYKNEVVAQIFIDKFPTKLKNKKSSAEILSEFEIVPFERSPIDEMELYNSVKISRASSIVAARVATDWKADSSTYCGNCSVVIPQGVRFVNIRINYAICPCCIRELMPIVHEYDEYADEELKEAIEVERFSRRL
jgi:hypothetical protein